MDAESGTVESSEFTEAASMTSPDDTKQLVHTITEESTAANTAEKEDTDMDGESGTRKFSKPIEETSMTSPDDTKQLAHTITEEFTVANTAEKEDTDMDGEPGTRESSKPIEERSVISPDDTKQLAHTITEEFTATNAETKEDPHTDGDSATEESSQPIEPIEASSVIGQNDTKQLGHTKTEDFTSATKESDEDDESKAAESSELIGAASVIKQDNTKQLANTSSKGDTDTDSESETEESSESLEADSVISQDDLKQLAHTAEDCFKACTYLSRMIAERAEIEKKYSTNLFKWESSWKNPMCHYPPDNTIKKALDVLQEECYQAYKLHLDISKDMLIASRKIAEHVAKEVSPTSSSGCKESKQMERDFKILQSSWRRSLKGVEMARAEYHTSIKKFKDILKKDSNAGTSKATRSSMEVTLTRHKYEICLENAEDFKKKHMREMMKMYQRCCDMEKKNLFTMKQAVHEYQKCLNDANELMAGLAYMKLADAINSVDVDEDVKIWEQKWGHGEQPEVPKFCASCPQNCVCKDLSGFDCS